MLSQTAHCFLQLCTQIELPGFTNFGKAPKGDTGEPPKSEALE